MILGYLLSLHEQLSLYHYFPREAIINLDMAAANLGRHKDHRHRRHLVDIVAVEILLRRLLIVEHAGKVARE
jgi:hypothetical protein